MSTPIRNGWGIFFVWWVKYAILRNSSGKLECSGHNLEPIPKAGIVFKIGLLVNAKALTRISQLNFPELLLRIE
jgi:hypothetical protein